jgi:Flp pilus assembly secretin CpaC
MLALSRAFVALGLAAAFSQIGTERPVQAAELVYQNAEVIKVHLDQAKLLKVPDGTSTLVVGNPLIADVAVQPGGMLVVTGKGYGNTNLVALDRSGAIIMEHQVQVQGPLGQTVVVFRGVERETYSCTPDCEKRITLGDTQNYFAATLGQSGTLSTQAQGGTPGK